MRRIFITTAALMALTVTSYADVMEDPSLPGCPNRNDFDGFFAAMKIGKEEAYLLAHGCKTFKKGDIFTQEKFEAGSKCIRGTSDKTCYWLLPSLPVYPGRR
jgi:hypothetical protein